jgi:predicted metal-dependent hydrolase
VTGEAEGNAGPRVRPRTATIQQGDREKAYRPIDREARLRALDSALAAYEQGDFFEAHELLEPAWMGTSNLAERHLYQGLIKIDAGYVHCVRGNPIGMARNLEGARKHLATSRELDPQCGPGLGIDVESLLAEVDVRLVSVRSAAAHVDENPSAVRDLAGTAPQLRPNGGG